MIINETNEGVRYITPAQDKYLCNGNGCYSELVYLADDADANDWYEVDEIPEEEEQGEEATVEDYMNALNELGVDTDAE